MPETSIKKNFAYMSTLTVSTCLMNFITFPYIPRLLGGVGVGLVSIIDHTVNYFLLHILHCPVQRFAPPHAKVCTQ